MDEWMFTCTPHPFIHSSIHPFIYMGMNSKELEQLLEKLPFLRKEIQKKIFGQTEAIDQLLITFLAGGHALLEGVPGLAKTLMIRTLADAIAIDFKRIQFTPDLMPTDIVGTEVLQENGQSGQRQFQFLPGPIFANIILADEINRTPPKTQAALLEAMQEKRVTYGGKNYPLERPFFILATQNPIEQAGTFPLPEAQLDRFLLYIKIGYPNEEEELQVLLNTTGNQDVAVNPVMTGEEILQLQKLVRDVHLNELLARKVNQLVRATRPATTSVGVVKDWVQWGAGPRAGQAMILTAKARALLNGRFSVIPEDLQFVAYPVLRHRILLNFKAEAESVQPDDVTTKLVESLKL